MSGKLPEWPKYKVDYLGWLQLDRDAALARMEALVEFAHHTYKCLDDLPFKGCTCGLHELLAACERRSGG